MVYELLRDGREEDVLGLLRDARRGFYFREQDAGNGQSYAMLRFVVPPLVWYAMHLMDVAAYPVMTKATTAVLRRFVRETPLAFFEGRWSINFFDIIQQRPTVMARIFADASVEKLLARPSRANSNTVRGRSLWQTLERWAPTEAGGNDARDFATVLIKTAHRVPHLVFSGTLRIYMRRARRNADADVVYALIDAAGDYIPEPREREVDMAHSPLMRHAVDTQNPRCIQAIVGILKDPEIADALQQAESDLEDLVRTDNTTRHTGEAIRFHQQAIAIMRGNGRYTGITKGAM